MPTLDTMDMELKMEYELSDNMETIIKTTPQITISKRLTESDVILYIPPSQCLLTLHERFTQLLCRIQKYEIDPGHEEINIPNTLLGRLERLKAHRVAPYAWSGSALNRASYLAAMKLKKRSIYQQQFANIIDSKSSIPGQRVDLFSKYYAIRKMKRYCTGPSKTREELDREMSDYWASKGKPRKDDDERDEYSLENDDNDANPKKSGWSSYNKEPKPLNYFNKFLAAIKTVSKAEEKAQLDKELDDYFGLCRKNLDDDLESYRQRDPRVNEAYSTKDFDERTNLDDDLDEYFAIKPKEERTSEVEM